MPVSYGEIISKRINTRGERGGKRGRQLGKQSCYSHEFSKNVSPPSALTQSNVDLSGRRESEDRGAVTIDREEWRGEAFKEASEAPG